MHLNQHIKLNGFNNLTKTLSFNFFDVCFVRTPSERRDYLDYIDEKYNSVALADILTTCAAVVGATVLNVSNYDYDPHGASVNVLIAEGPLTVPMVGNHTAEICLAHLDKSHICVHTYPEYHPDDGIATFRADIDVATCGDISPLRALNWLIARFDGDVMNIDYRVRGFTRDVLGRKHYTDQGLGSIQDHIAPEVLASYHATDCNSPEARLWNTKLRLRDIPLDEFLFDPRGRQALDPTEQARIEGRLRREIDEIYGNYNLD